jgi:hypothetical protein
MASDDDCDARPVGMDAGSNPIALKGELFCLDKLQAMTK